MTRDKFDRFNEVNRKKAEVSVKSSFFEIDYECPKNPLKVIDALKKHRSFISVFQESSEDLKKYINETLIPFNN